MSDAKNIALYKAALQKATEEGRPQEDIEFLRNGLDNHLTEADIWNDRNEAIPEEHPHRNIEIKYMDAVNKELTGLVSSYLISVISLTHWREVRHATLEEVEDESSTTTDTDD